MKPGNIDWTDPASRFACSDWLEEQGRAQEANLVRNVVVPPADSCLEPVGDESSNSYGDGYRFGYTCDGDNCFGDGQGYGRGDRHGDGHGIEVGGSLRRCVGDGVNNGSGDSEGIGEVCPTTVEESLFGMPPPCDDEDAEIDPEDDIELMIDLEEDSELIECESGVWFSEDLTLPALDNHPSEGIRLDDFPDEYGLGTSEDPESD